MPTQVANRRRLKKNKYNVFRRDSPPFIIITSYVLSYLSQLGSVFCCRWQCGADPRQISGSVSLRSQSRQRRTAASYRTGGGWQARGVTIEWGRERATVDFPPVDPCHLLGGVGASLSGCNANPWMHFGADSFRKAQKFVLLVTHLLERFRTEAGRHFYSGKPQWNQIYWSI